MRATISVLLAAAAEAAVDCRRHAEALQALRRYGCIMHDGALLDAPAWGVSLAFENYSVAYEEWRQARQRVDFIATSFQTAKAAEVVREDPEGFEEARRGIAFLRQLPLEEVPLDPATVQSMLRESLVGAEFNVRQQEEEYRKRMLEAHGSPHLARLIEDGALDNVSQFFTLRSCDSSNGMWGLPSAEPIRHKYMRVAKAFRAGPGDLILDVGAGCADHAAAMSEEFGACLVAQDLSPLNVRHFSRLLPEALAGACPGNSIDFLEALPPAVDYLLLNGVLSTLPGEGRCELVRAAARALRLGGRAWFGYLDFPEEWWADCSPDDSVVHTVNELDFFEGRTEYAFETWIHSAVLTKVA